MIEDKTREINIPAMIEDKRRTVNITEDLTMSSPESVALPLQVEQVQNEARQASRGNKMKPVGWSDFSQKLERVQLCPKPSRPDSRCHPKTGLLRSETETHLAPFGPGQSLQEIVQLAAANRADRWLLECGMGKWRLPSYSSHFWGSSPQDEW